MLLVILRNAREESEPEKEAAATYLSLCCDPDGQAAVVPPRGDPLCIVKG